MAGRFDSMHHSRIWRAALAAIVLVSCCEVAEGVIIRRGRRGGGQRWQDGMSTAIDPSVRSLAPEDLQDVEVVPEVLRLVGQLDSDDFALREAATEALSRNDSWREQIYALLSGDGLSVEQRCRLLQVVREQLVNTPRGALGIEMAPIMPIGGEALEIRIVDLIAGLPAERVLQVGDRIVLIDHQPLFVQEDLQSRVQSKRPGEPVHVTVKRAKVDDNGRVIRDERGEPITETLEIDIALGSAEILDKQQRNMRTASNRVKTARKQEADAITYAFGQAPLEIGINGGLSAMLERDPIDDHPVILNLLTQQEMINTSNPENERIMREMWRKQLLDLIGLSNHPGLSEEERARMRLVAERFEELMNSVP